MSKLTKLALRLGVLGPLMMTCAMHAQTAAVLHLRPTEARQAQLDQLLKDQRDPSSPDYQRWITPEEFGARFGATPEDLSRLTAWLDTQGLRVDFVPRGRGWLECSGAQTILRIPPELASIVSGVSGINDPKTEHAFAVAPASGNAMAPADFAKLYNVKALHDAGFNGAGQRIVLVGRTAIHAADIEVFRKAFQLPMDVPETVLYGKQPETDADDAAQAEMEIEWAGAVAPNATIVYAYASDPFTALRHAIDDNLGTVLSSTYGSAEQTGTTAFRNLAQQANAQGITWLNASGSEVQQPANVPEVVAMGGTPGASRQYAKPAWQNGPSVRDDGARNVPDLSLSASGHDAYHAFTGTWWKAPAERASAPSMAGIVAILNQYLVAKGVQATPGVGNINANIYHLAANTTDVFRDPATGLGSIDAYNFVTEWAGIPGSTGTLMTLSAGDNGFTATVKAAKGTALPAGAVTFFHDATPLGSAMLIPMGTSALATFNVSPSSAWTTIIARYSGNSTFDNATASLDFKRAAHPAVSIAAAPARTTTNIAITSRTINLSPCTRIEATVRNGSNHVPGGSIAFYSGDTLLGTEPIYEGTASVTMRDAAFSFGANQIRAVYVPAAGFATSTMAAVAIIAEAQ